MAEHTAVIKICFDISDTRFVVSLIKQKINAV